MKESQDYLQDIQEIRSMMERSSKFLSLSGGAGIMAGIYALTGAYIAYYVLEFDPETIAYTSSSLPSLTALAMGVLGLALLTAIFFSRNKAKEKGEQIWNPVSKRLLSSMAIPLVTGGLIIAILTVKGLLGLAAPLMLIFYGLSLIHAGQYTIREVTVMGYVQILLGIISTWYIEQGLLFWTLGFGGVHMIYGIYMHFRYER